MKHIFFGSVSLLALCVAAPAIAADMRIKASPAAVALHNWTGCYVGVHAGGGVMDDSWADKHGAGGLAGGQIGCDWQSGQLVWGLEASGSWSGIKAKEVFSEPGFSEETTARNRWDVDISGRVGVAIERALIYGKVGVAWGKFKFGYSNTEDEPENGSGTLPGLLLGTGLEYALAPNWSAKLEYNFIGFPNKVLSFTDPSEGDFNLSVGASKHIVKAGLNWRFGDFGKGPVATAWPGSAAMPGKAPVYKAAPAAVSLHNWTGCYIGAHAGGGVMDDSWNENYGAGGLAGGQIGCDWQTGQLVWGLEASGSWSGIKNKEVFSELGFSDETSTRNRWDVDISGRVGFAFGHALLYGKVGAAWGKFDIRYTSDDSDLHFASKTLPGLLLGTGLEYAFAPNWSAKLEYNYIGFPNKVVRFTDLGDGGSVPFFDLSFSASKHIVKAGLNYRLGEFGKEPVGMAPVPVAAAPYNWTGCYIGGHAGGGVMHDSWTLEHGAGGLAGGQIGCDWQTGRIVWGLEASGSWSGIKSEFSIADPEDDNEILTSRNRWDVDISGRFGFAIERALIYGKVGAAWGKFNFRFQDSIDAGDYDIASKKLTGLLLGTGFEYAFAPNWSAKLEYNYIGFPNKVASFASTVEDDYNLSVSASKHIVKAGLNWRFGDFGKAPVVSKY